MALRLGMKVVCIRADYSDDTPPPYPQVGDTATISWIGHAHDGSPTIDTFEFPSPETSTFERGYDAECWTMLNPSKQGVEA